jgi:hypothetical protein
MKPARLPSPARANHRHRLRIAATAALLPVVSHRPLTKHLCAAALNAAHDLADGRISLPNK